ncbi:MAG: hypothetical protein M1434_01650 [Chloroflexi bacterium]|nr:hypothetical protein [Chloroflexota bacterium]MCL5273433.1 hypothetical protein [Chloroflexota bacterium]
MAISVKGVLSVVAGFFILLASSTSALAAGNDFVLGDLRYDLEGVQYAGAYQDLIYADRDIRPTGQNDFTSAWIGIDLANQPGTYGRQFTQVGLILRPDGLHWFVYAESGVTCYRGASNYGSLGCQGNAGDIVSVGNWYTVELRRVSGANGPEWVAMVYDTYLNPYVVAAIHSSSGVIYRAQATAEQGYSGSTNPHTAAYYLHYHPSYFVQAPFVFTDWPRSTTFVTGIVPHQYSEIRLWASDGTQICPTYYGATIYYPEDLWVWFAGTGGQTCESVLFWPGTWLPAVLR